MGAWAHFNIENVGGCLMAWASQRSRRAINYAFIVVSDRISGPSCIFPSYTWAPFQSKWGRAKTAVASNRAAAVSSMPYAAFQYCKVIWFYKSGHFRIIHKGYAELLRSRSFRQQLRHDHEPLVVGIGIVILPAAGGKGQDGIIFGESHAVKVKPVFPCNRFKEADQIISRGIRRNIVKANIRDE